MLELNGKVLCDERSPSKAKFASPNARQVGFTHERVDDIIEQHSLVDVLVLFLEANRHYLAQWQRSRGVADLPRLPIYVPFSNLRRQTGLERRLLNAFYRDFEDLDSLRKLAPSERLYVVDDVDADDVERCGILAELKAASRRSRFILLRGSKSFLFLGSRFFRHFEVQPTTLRIEDLPRKTIRDLTKNCRCPP